LSFLLPEDPVTPAWLIQSGILFGGLAVPVIIGGVIFRDKVPSESVEIGILLGLTVTILTMLAGFIYPNYTGAITLGVVPATATGTPLLDVSRVIGSAATIVGMLIGYVMHMVRR
jgi:hypothetical protein